MANDIEPADAAKIEAAAVQMAGDAETSKPAAEGETAPATGDQPAAEGETAPATGDQPAAAGENPPPEDKAARRRRIVKKILKWTGIVCGVFFLLLLLVILFRDSIIKAYLPKYLSSMIGVKVEVADVDTSLFKGTLRVKGITVANPDGYSKDKKALALKELYVKIDVGSLFTKKVVIEEIRLTGLAVNVESHKLLALLNEKECNLMAIVENYKRLNPPKEKKESSEEKSKTKVVVRLLKIEKSSVSLAVEDVSVNKTFDNLALEERDLGEEEKKSWKDDLKERAAKIWNYITDELKDDINSFLKTIIPKGFSSLTGVEAEVAEVELSPEGTLRIAGVKVANPEGYGKDKKAIELKELYVRVDRDSLLTEKIVIEELRVNGLAVNVEAAELQRLMDEKKCNLTDICENLQRRSSPGEKTAPSDAKANAGGTGKPKPKVVIRLLKVENSSVSLAIKDMSIDQKFDNIFIEERDLGEGKNGFEERGKAIVAEYIAKLTSFRSNDKNDDKNKVRKNAKNTGFNFKRRKKKK